MAGKKKTTFSSILQSSLTWLILCWIMAIIFAVKMPGLFKNYAGDDWRPSHVLFIYIGLFGPVICCTIAWMGLHPEMILKIKKVLFGIEEIKHKREI